MEEFKNLKRVAMNEARKFDAACANKEEFTEGDLKRFDCLMHGLKCMLTTEAMLEAQEYEENMSRDMGNSGYRGRSPMTGRYVSKDENSSYTEGYSRGYSEAMNHNYNGGNSGHTYPQPTHYPYPERNW